MLSVLLTLLTLSLLFHGARAWRGAMVQDAHRGQPPDSRVLRWVMLCREAIAHTAVVAFLPFGWLDGIPPSRSHGPPVLLIPHPGANRVGWFFMATFLRRRLGRATWAMRLPADDVGIPEQADRVAIAARKLARWLRADQIDIVTHGAGGFAAAFFASHLDDAGLTRRVVALGCPWKGTRAAVFESPALRDALVSPIPAAADHPDLWSIWCSDDPVIIPAEHAIAHPDRAIEIEAAGHLGLLGSARAMRAVARCLSEAPHPAPEPSPSAAP